MAENVGIFSKLYDENVNYELVPGEYHAVAETKLIGGQHIDMMYSEEDRLIRWNTAGWNGSLEGLPGIEEIKASMYPINVHNMSLGDGSLGGLPYYTGFNSFVCNEKHLDAAKLEPPATWEEFLDQCRKLKKDKVAEYPYISAWGRQWASLSWSLFSIWYSQGAKVFDAEHKPDFNQEFRDVLEMHKTLYAGAARPAGRDDPARRVGPHSPPVSTPTWSCTTTTRRCSTPRPCRRSPGLPQRDHAGQDALDLHLDRRLPDAPTRSTPTGSGT